MPTTKVKTPDGSTIEVRHPEGATEDDILQFAAAEYNNRKFAEILPEPPDEPDAVPQGGTAFDALGKGLSFGFSDEIAGAGGALVNSALGLFGGGTGESFGEAYRGIRDAARENEAAFAARNPLGSLGLEIAGGALTGGVGAAKAGAFQAAKSAPTLLGRLAPVASTGAIQGGLYGLGAGEGSVGEQAKSTLQGAALGGVTAPVIPALAGGVRKGVSRAFQVTTDSPTYQKALQTLKDKVGITIFTTGQKTGSKPIKSIESTFSETVFGAPIGTRLEKTRKQVQSKLLRMAGFADDDINVGEVNQGAIDKAAERFTNRYNKILGGRVVNLDEDEFIDALATIESRHRELIPFQQKKQITDIVSQFLDVATDGPMSGRKYQQIRSELGRIESNNVARPAMQSLYRDLKHAMDDAFVRQAGIGSAKRNLDRMYNRFAKIRDTYLGSGAIQTSSGDIPLSALLRRASRRGKSADKEFTEIVRAAQTVLGDPTPNSATASRLANLAFLGEGGAAMALGGADAGMIGVGLPVGSALALSRGGTGSGIVDRLIQSGLLTAPVTVPAAQRISE